LKETTKKIKNTIGEGGFGEMLYGMLDGGQEVAIKFLSTSFHQSKQEFFNEVPNFPSCKIKKCVQCKFHMFNFNTTIYIILDQSMDCFFYKLSFFCWCITRILCHLLDIALQKNNI
jgi:hypothetical protein